MKHLLKTNIGRLRILGYIEGTSLLVLVFIGMPLKYYFESPSLDESLGPLHGGIFVLFVLIVLIVAMQLKWKFWITSKVILSSFIPFGTFYIDKTILSKV